MNGKIPGLLPRGENRQRLPLPETGYLPLTTRWDRSSPDAERARTWDSPSSRSARAELRELLEKLCVCFWLTVVGGNMQLALVSDLCPEQTPAFPRVPSCPSFITAPSPGKKPERRL